ncbi:hypothetical protein [Enterococcus casseliflavus]|uniref:hypothetical protein n=1 Tax=Enterococcus casseliflavus TaxID=37734 RepID=UPI002DBAEB4A|nr:hypothetical protein [Enterococcus casseliflavus]MEB6146576.1 hypothetical protein [Enterococcus casseliflavus]
MTNNLIKLVESGEIAKTGAKPKLPTTIPNLTDTMLDVYRIPLKYLYYNDENGRISTQIRRKFGTLAPYADEFDPDYNNKIAGFIEEDNASALMKTKKSIKEKGQQVYGYVLQDGRVIDGNRRFTALRQVQSEIGTTQFFEAVILPFTYDAKANRAQIKRLELAIQMGTEEKLQYDPVDLAVDIYKTVIKDELMSAKDYAIESNISVKDVESRIATVDLIHDFLLFINTDSENYHIIKDLKLYTHLYELAKKLTSLFPNKGPNYEQTKVTTFTFLGKAFLTGGDTLRESRDYIKKIVGSTVNNQFNDRVEETVEDFRDKIERQPIRSAAEYRKRLEEATSELRQISEAYNNTVNQQNRGKNVENFIANVDETLNNLKEMKRGDGLMGNLKFSDFSKEQLAEIREMLVEVHLLSGNLIEVYGNEL